MTFCAAEKTKGPPAVEISQSIQPKNRKPWRPTKFQSVYIPVYLYIWVSDQVVNSAAFDRHPIKWQYLILDQWSINCYCYTWHSTMCSYRSAACGRHQKWSRNGKGRLTRKITISQIDLAHKKPPKQQLECHTSDGQIRPDWYIWCSRPVFRGRQVPGTYDGHDITHTFPLWFDTGGSCATAYNGKLRSTSRWSWWSWWSRWRKI